MQELSGPGKETVRFTEIDEGVKRNLDRFVYASQFRKETQDFYRTSFASKCAKARRSLRKQGLVARSKTRGHWELTLGPKPWRAVTNRVFNFAKKAIEKLEEINASPEAIQAVCQLWFEFQATLEATIGSSENREVEDRAIKFIQAKEPGWHRPPNPNNPGFDLYQTANNRKNGEITRWCEVKSLSDGFRQVSMTATEFKMAQEKGKDYWLYIVENVSRLDSGGEPVIYKINDPAGRVERFAFRCTPWRQAAEK